MGLEAGGPFEKHTGRESCAGLRSCGKAGAPTPHREGWLRVADGSANDRGTQSDMWDPGRRADAPAPGQAHLGLDDAYPKVAGAIDPRWGQPLMRARLRCDGLGTGGGRYWRWGGRGLGNHGDRSSGRETP